MRSCTVENCEKKHHAKGYCKIHYSRLKRTGDPLKIKSKNQGRHITKDGYIMLTGYKLHPIASAKGNIMEHRLVLYNKLQGRNTQCHWCNKMLKWHNGEKICADHLDWNRQNNDPENLVPSCISCNSGRKAGNTPLSFNHGETLTYKYKCNKCKSRMREYQKERSRLRRSR